MQGLSPKQLLQVWENAAGKTEVDRALTILAHADLGSYDDLASLSIGERDRLLMELREATLGSALQVYAECPNCAERLEFVLDSARLRHAVGEPVSSHQLEAEGFTVQFRLPDSKDLAAAARSGQVAEARTALLESCVLEAACGNTAVAARDLPAFVQEAVALELANCDPLAEILINLTCPFCRHRWQALFDVARFFWDEINGTARHLLQQVATLARTYGWREADILAMSPQRRQYYLEAM